MFNLQQDASSDLQLCGVNDWCTSHQAGVWKHTLLADLSCGRSVNADTSALLSCCCCCCCCGLKYVMEESLWKAEIKKLFLWNIVNSVWVDVGGHRGDKRPACCACMFVRASRSGLELPRASSLTDGQGKEQTGTGSQKLGCQGGPALTGPH